MPTINQLIRKQRHGLKAHNKVPALEAYFKAKGPIGPGPLDRIRRAY